MVMTKGAYRTSVAPVPRGENAPRPPAPPREEFAIPVMFFALGGALIAIGLRGGETCSTEGGLGVLAILFSGWSFVQALRATR